MKRFIFFVLVLIPIFSFGKYKALIVTGQSNHNWKVASVILEQIYNQSGMFEATVIASPEKGRKMSEFSPDFSACDVVVMIYNGDAWSGSAQTSLDNYVKNGGALVIVHEADNAFPEWKAYNEMIGLGGWGDRDEKSGPYVYYENKKEKIDTSAGSGGMHGQQSEVLVVIRNKRHPITKGLPSKWLHSTDELYGKLRGPAQNMTILATAYSDPATNGSGRDEPCLMTIDYGKGRVFHTIFGHISAPPFVSMNGVGFQHTLLRGTEWTITGKVTQKIPANFPTAKSSSNNTIRFKMN
ncbi:MAG: ThuA domain-containing protein [Prolixibacteraceae bacterium]